MCVSERVCRIGVHPQNAACSVEKRGGRNGQGLWLTCVQVATNAREGSEIGIKEENGNLTRTTVVAVLAVAAVRLKRNSGSLAMRTLMQDNTVGVRDETRMLSNRSEP